MRLYATFANRKYDPENFELIECWDEYSVDGNYDGWQKAVAAHVREMGEDILRHVTMLVEVDESKIISILNPSEEELTLPGDASMIVDPGMA